MSEVASVEKLQSSYEPLLCGLLMIIDAVTKVGLGIAILIIPLMQIAHSYLCRLVELLKTFEKEVALLHLELDQLRVGVRPTGVGEAKDQKLRGFAASLENDSHVTSLSAGSRQASSDTSPNPSGVSQQQSEMLSSSTIISDGFEASSPSPFSGTSEARKCYQKSSSIGSSSKESSATTSPSPAYSPVPSSMATPSSSPVSSSPSLPIQPSPAAAPINSNDKAQGIDSRTPRPRKALLFHEGRTKTPFTPALETQLRDDYAAWPALRDGPNFRDSPSSQQDADSA